MGSCVGSELQAHSAPALRSDFVAQTLEYRHSFSEVLLKGPRAERVTCESARGREQRSSSTHQRREEGDFPCSGAGQRNALRQHAQRYGVPRIAKDSFRSGLIDVWVVEEAKLGTSLQECTVGIVNLLHRDFPLFTEAANVEANALGVAFEAAISAVTFPILTSACIAA